MCTKNKGASLSQQLLFGWVCIKSVLEIAESKPGKEMRTFARLKVGNFSNFYDGMFGGKLKVLGVYTALNIWKEDKIVLTSILHLNSILIVKQLERFTYTIYNLQKKHYEFFYDKMQQI